MYCGDVFRAIHSVEDVCASIRITGYDCSTTAIISKRSWPVAKTAVLTIISYHWTRSKDPQLIFSCVSNAPRALSSLSVDDDYGGGGEISIRMIIAVQNRCGVAAASARSKRRPDKKKE